MYEFLIVVVFIGVIWFVYNKPKTSNRSTFVSSTDTNASMFKDWKIPKLPEQIPWFGILLTIIALVIVFFTEEIVSFDWTSISLGRTVEKLYGTGSSKWIWAPIVISILVYFGNKVSGAVANGVLVIFCVVGLVISFAISMVGQDKFMEGVTVMSGGQPKDGGIDCLNREKAQALIFYKGNKDLPPICPSSGTVFINADYGTSLEISFSPKFAEENKHLLEGKSVSDFVDFQPPNFPGALAGSYRLKTITSGGDTRKVDAFQKTGLKYVVITVTGN